MHKAGDDPQLIGLREIAEKAQHGIFFHKLMDAVAELVFIGARLGFDGEGDGRLWQRNRRVLDGMRLLPQCVSGDRLLQLGDGTDVAGMEFVHRNCILTLENGQMRQLLAAVAGEVLHGGIVLEHAGKNFEVGNASCKGIVHRLKDVN